MKKQIKLKGLKSLTREDQKKIAGGLIPKDPWNDDGCGWNMCRNQFGRCTLFTDHCV
ncbi:hypothetical protein V2E39_06500 [Chryseobacterium arthrosphaerae]|uniref:Bacteriocin n=1 Tax=Chryseobacterium arthrosphaerae TaxID=651561 RepID=A0ABU7QX16_9FLAO|nr:hypothetical protein [Chryseobacterium arthrosphaerae]MDG4653334.1 hypothetical protein [Chryseobacterium arthrosphaerae]QUY55256.1 hypothetical protein I2F65_20715 [Chryseobacterium arthrosphaerae]